MSSDDIQPRKPSFGLALVPVVLTLLVLGIQLFYFGDFTPHIPLAIGLAITGLVGTYLGHDWGNMENGVFRVINVSLPSVSVLIVVGMIIGVWIASGTVPSLIYYGLKVLSPEIFLAASMIMCAVVSVSLGTSWGTVGTIGLALMGIGAGFDVPVYWTAGAVVSGAFFGDKISPLSDTTNLSPAVTGVNLFDHIKNMMPTTVPAMLIALGIYIWAGYSLIDANGTSFERIDSITTALDDNFAISPWLLAPALIVIVLAIMKKPPIPSLFAGVVAGAITAMLVQGASLHDIFGYANGGYSIDTGIAEIDSLLNRGGIQDVFAGLPRDGLLYTEPQPRNRGRRDPDVAADPLERRRCLRHLSAGPRGYRREFRKPALYPAGVCMLAHACHRHHLRLDRFLLAARQ